jgi:hypothetical protein
MAAKQKLPKKLIDDTNQEMILDAIEDMDRGYKGGANYDVNQH